MDGSNLIICKTYQIQEMGDSEHTSAGATRTRMREILNYRCECELGIRNEMGTFMIFGILTKPMKINQKLS